jgi:hypothetical protein
MREPGKWKRTLARWREKRRTKREQAAARQHGGRAARAARQRQVDGLKKFRDPGASGGPF